MKKTIAYNFFLILAYILGSKVLKSELRFLIILLTGLSLIILIVFHCQKDMKNRLFLKKQFIIFLFLSISFLSARYILAPKTPSPSSEETISGGVLLFYIYLAPLFLLKLNTKTNSILALICLFLTPFLLLAKFSYTAETFAVFGFLLLIVSALKLAIEVRQNYVNI